MDDLALLKKDVTEEEQTMVLAIQSAVDDAILESIPYIRSLINDTENDPGVRLSAIRILAQSMGQYASRRREYVGDVRRGRGANITINMPNYDIPAEEGEVLHD